MTLKEAKSLAYDLKLMREQLQFGVSDEHKRIALLTLDTVAKLIGENVRIACGYDPNGNRRISVTDFEDMYQGRIAIDVSKL